ncbi:MAG: NAD(P)/FAD-dependent oxidoreductase [Nannocystaceae bacterium]|nr:tryptophan 7-halogenase [bacterium]
MPDDCGTSPDDVVILGAGLAGLALAIQLRQRNDALRVVVLERGAFPVPSAAHKVGESTVEVGSHYYNHVLGLAGPLSRARIPKLGLRYFFPCSNNAIVEARPELGLRHYHAVGSTNFDRGAQENVMAEQARALGVVLEEGVRVRDVELSEDDAAHTVVAEDQRAWRARWVIDATGRRSFLKRKLGLVEGNGHVASSAWFRIARPLAVDDMSTDDAWRRRVPFGMRRLSTNHFMGEGYWLWWIPLADGSISIGLVADAAVHPFDTYNTWEKMQAWLAEYEPATAEMIAPHAEARLDFRTQKNFSYGAKQVFSKHRWALTGEAGVFVDPFYSPGSDFIAFSNDFITELVAKDAAGDDISRLAFGFNRQYLSLYRSFLSLYEGQYAMFGNAQVASLKIVYDYSAYWASTALLFFQRKLTQPDFLRRVTVEMVKVARLGGLAQAFFRAWAQRDQGRGRAEGMLNYHALGYLTRWQTDLARAYTDDELVHVMRENRKVLEQIHVWLYQRATGRAEEINPYKLALSDDDEVVQTSNLDMLGSLEAFLAKRTDLRDGVYTVRAAAKTASASAGGSVRPAPGPRRWCRR